MSTDTPAAVVPTRNKGGRPRTRPIDSGPKKPRGRPRKVQAPPAESQEAPVEKKAPAVERKPAPAIVAEPEALPLFIVAEPAEVARPVPRPTPPPGSQDEPAPEPLEVAVPADVEQKRMVDEYGELDRRMQLHAADAARYEQLKRTIKSWFDQAPSDADGTVEGDVYLLHLSARERERRIRSMDELVEMIGLDKLLELATVPLGVLEDLLGKSRVAALATEARSGSRRIKAIPKHPASAIAMP
jgi:hypothetical protein